jgi:hypothetical protein
MDVSKRAWQLARKKFCIPAILSSRISLSQNQVSRLPGSSPLVLPSFLVIGPPRTATGWLHEVLKHHALLPCSLKETRFFDNYFHRGVNWYVGHYPRMKDQRPIGEVAPTYFASGAARERIASLIPQAKVVCIFRDPVERMLSLYRLKRAYGMVPWSFEQALTRDPELTESSRYASNLKAWQHALGAKQVLATLFEDLETAPQPYLDRVVDFIGVPRFVLTPSQVSRVFSSESMTLPRNHRRTRRATRMAEWFKAQRLGKVVMAVKKSPMIKLFLGGGPAFAEVSRDVCQRLYELFRPEVEELEVLLDRDLSAWKGLSTSVGAGAGI